MIEEREVISMRPSEGGEWEAIVQVRYHPQWWDSLLGREWTARSERFVGSCTSWERVRRDGFDAIPASFEGYALRRLLHSAWAYEKWRRAGGK